ncbi:MAG TPA: hypothetical protein VFP39_04985, partial [Gemmatimonadales bacterium]|nr:hypothetical protein [Gemmatimonadales bacterium]
PGEVNGQSYHFVSPAEFDRMVRAGEFLEWAEYAGNRYGTLKREVEAALNAGKHVLLDIEVQGARQVWSQQLDPRPIRIFILPPSGKGWLERLKGRDTETPESLRRRKQWAIGEIQQVVDVEHWEHIIVNDDLEHAIAEVNQIIDESGGKQHRPSMQRLHRLVTDLKTEAEQV